MAFFPVLPGLIEAVHVVTGLGYRVSALVAGNLGGLAATLVVFALVQEVVRPEDGSGRSGPVQRPADGDHPLDGVHRGALHRLCGRCSARRPSRGLADRRPPRHVRGPDSHHRGCRRGRCGGRRGDGPLAQARQRRGGGHRLRPRLRRSPGYVLWVGIERGDLGAYGALQEVGMVKPVGWREQPEFVRGTLATVAAGCR